MLHQLPGIPLSVAGLECHANVTEGRQGRARRRSGDLHRCAPSRRSEGMRSARGLRRNDIKPLPTLPSVAGVPKVGVSLQRRPTTMPGERGEMRDIPTHLKKPAHPFMPQVVEMQIRYFEEGACLREAGADRSMIKEKSRPSLLGYCRSPVLPWEEGHTTCRSLFSGQGAWCCAPTLDLSGCPCAGWSLFLLPACREQGEHDDFRHWNCRRLPSIHFDVIRHDPVQLIYRWPPVPLGGFPGCAKSLEHRAGIR